MLLGNATLPGNVTCNGCEESYGFLPCSSSLGGSLFLMLLYGLFLLKGATLMSDGSEHLLEVLDPGIIGGLVLPILGATPDSIMILVAGLGCAKEEAAEQVAIGLGTLCGSTVMLLTIAWGGSVIVGRCDLNARGRAIDGKLTRPWYDIFGTGVTADHATRHGSWIMMATSLIYLIVQVPAALGYAYDPAAALAGAVICAITLVAYSVYQIVFPELQRRKIDAAKTRRHKWAAISKLHGAFRDLIDADGVVSRAVSDRVFEQFDLDHSGFIDTSELMGLLVGLALTDGLGSRIDIGYWIREFDRDGSNSICKEEFHAGLQRWVIEKLRQTGGDAAWITREFDAAGLSDEELPENEAALLENGHGEGEHGHGHGSGEPDEEGDGVTPVNKRSVVATALSLLASGTLLCALMADPMVNAVQSFSVASGIPSFFIAFVVTPLASNASELVSSLLFAMKKKKKNISLTFAQVTGAVIMNNSMCLGLFLMVVYIQKLSWTYTSEVIVTIGATFFLGALTARNTTFSTFWAFPVLLVYPASIAAVHILDNYFGVL